MFLTSVQALIDHFKHDLKIKSDDVVFLFSGIWGLGKLEDGLNTIDRAFDEVLETGALIVPTFTYSLPGNQNFSSHTPCPDMGAFSNFVVGRSDYLRTDNPNFSVCIRQSKSNASLVSSLLDVGPDCFGEGSIFEKVYELSATRDCWVLLLGGAFNDVLYRSTFIHFAQQMGGVPHRYLKEFYDPSTKRQIKQLVRYFSSDEYAEINGGQDAPYNFPIEEDFEQYGKDVQAAGLLTIKPFGLYPSRMIGVRESVDLMVEKICTVPNYCVSPGSIRHE